MENCNWLEFPKNTPEETGRYEVYRESCDKMHYLTWNGSGWSSDHNAITHFRKKINPFNKHIQ